MTNKFKERITEFEAMINGHFQTIRYYFLIRKSCKMKLISIKSSNISFTAYFQHSSRSLLFFLLLALVTHLVL